MHLQTNSYWTWLSSFVFKTEYRLSIEAETTIQFVFGMNYQILSDTMKAFLWASMLPFVLAAILHKNPESKCKCFAECHALGLSALIRIEAS